jgi:hypothetical protein
MCINRESKNSNLGNKSNSNHPTNVFDLQKQSINLSRQSLKESKRSSLLSWISIGLALLAIVVSIVLAIYI